MRDPALAALHLAAAALSQAQDAIDDALAEAGAGNLRPAPLYLRDATVDALLNFWPSRQLAFVPIEPTKLVDRPRGSAVPPREEYASSSESGAKPLRFLAPIKDEAPAPSGESARPANMPGVAIDPDAWAMFKDLYLDPRRFPLRRCHGRVALWARGQGITIPSCETFRRWLMEEGVTRPAVARQVLAERQATPAPPIRAIDTRRDAIRRQDSDRDARALETPVDSHMAKADRLDVIRAAARKVQQRPVAPARLAIGARDEKAAPLLPVLASELRRQRLAAAIAHLKRFGVLVDVVDRMALIRKYRVSGKRDSLFAEDVIAIAAERGFEAEAGRG